MITAAVLCDLVGAKIIASRSFTKIDITGQFVQTALEIFYGQASPDERIGTCIINEEECGVCFSKIDDRTMLIGVLDSNEPEESEITLFDSLATQLTTLLEGTTEKVTEQAFSSLVDSTLRKLIRFCFLVSGSINDDNKTGLAIDHLMKSKSREDAEYTDSIGIGPFAVKAVQIDPSLIEKGSDTSSIENSDLLVYVVSGSQANLEYLESTLKTIRRFSSAPFIVVPGSDSELKMTREIEMKLELDLCDSVSTDSRRLIISILGIAGLTDFHEELAFERWSIDTLPELEIDDSSSQPVAVGHQAFYVVNKSIGEAAFSFYYEEPSSVIERAPNIVAAISMFKFDESSSETSVFQAGDLRYALIEREGFIFTLITGEGDKISELRERFSSLPELYLEDPPALIEDPENFYTYPAFTLKLLATIPPEDLPGKYVPVKLNEPEWTKFEDWWMQEFLKSVWATLDGKTSISKITGASPLMTMGALHFLLHIKAIDVSIKVVSSDVPRISGNIESRVVSLYSHLERILPLVDGNRSIEDLSKQVGIDSSILIVMFTELCKRGFVDFE